MLGQPVSMLIPRVVGFKLTGAIPPGVTATDVVLTITEMLRKHGVVGKFVEFYGEGVAEVPLANRATIGNMSPEFGSTAAMFPIDEVTIDYLRLTGRSEEQVALVEAYAKTQGLWHDPKHEPVFREYLELDLSTVVPSIAGPKRPQDRIILAEARATFRKTIPSYVDDDDGQQGYSKLDEALEETFPASDPGQVRQWPRRRRSPPCNRPPRTPRAARSKPVTVKSDERGEFVLDHGAVVIAAITSCTNTSNPEVMLGAALLARNAVEKGLTSKPWVKTTMAPGSQVVTDYYDKSGLWPYLEKLGFYLVGYGCTTCIGNSGPLPDEVSAAINDNDLAVTAVLSGNRNFEGRINPDVKMNYLASPPLVIAYALAGTMDFDFENAAARHRQGRQRRLPQGHLAVAEEFRHHRLVDQPGDVHQELRRRVRRRRALAQPAHARAARPSSGTDESTYVRKPPYFDGMPAEPEPVADITGARVLAKLGDSVTTDHISPAGSIKADTPAGAVPRRARRRAQGLQLLRFAPRQPRGDDPRHVRQHPAAEPAAGRRVRAATPATSPRTDAPQAFIYDAAQNYAAQGIPLVVLGGKEYGSGSSRDWAAKGTAPARACGR